MQKNRYRPPSPDDIVLFVESEDWCFYGDLSGGDQVEIESRDYVIVKYETLQWGELVKQRDESIGVKVSQ